MLVFAADSLRILDANLRAVEKYGHTKKEFLQLTVKELCFNRDSEQIYTALEDLNRKYRSLELHRHQTKTGKPFYVQVHFSPYKFKDEAAGILTINDVTKRVKAEEKSNKAYRELSHHITNNPLAYIKWDRNFRINEWSERAEEITGYTEKEMMGRTPMDLKLADSYKIGEFADRTQKVIEGNIERDQLEIRITSGNGEIKDLRIYVSAMRNENKELESVLTLLEDVTEEKRRKKKLQDHYKVSSFINELNSSIGEASTHMNALEIALKKICEFIDWPAGHIYQRVEGDQFESTGIWHTQSEKKYAALRKATGEIIFKKGKGFIGKIIENDKPDIIHNINSNKGFIRRRNHSLEVTSCFAFPVHDHDKIEVILEFFNPVQQELSDSFYEGILTIENQLGRILERSKSRMELRQNEQKYRRLFEQANDGIFMVENQHFIDCNSQIEKIFGYSREEIIGSTPFDFSPERQPDGQLSEEKGKKIFQKVLNGSSQRFEWKHIRKDGKMIDTEVSLNKLVLNDGTYVQAFIRDKTREKKAEKELKRRQKLFETLFFESHSAICMVDPDNCVMMVNRSFEKLFGYKEQEIIGRDLDTLIVSGKDRQKGPILPKKVPRKGVFDPDLLRYSKEGEAIDVMIGAIPVYLDDDLIAGLAIYTDIRERKNSERQLQKSLEEKQVLLEEIHHRVKNNLAVISGILQLQVFESNEKRVKETLNDSQIRIKSIALIHEMLYESKDFSDISFDRYVHQLVERIHDTMQLESGRISIGFDMDEIKLNINQAVPCALLINEILTNIYKHAFKGIEEGHIDVVIKKRKQQINLSISDNGVGLPEDFKLKEDGSLGLTLIDTLCQQLNAQLSYCGAEGTTFQLSFRKKEVPGSSSTFVS